MITIIDAIRELCKEKHPTSSWGMHDYDEDNITDLSVLKIDGGDTELLFTFDDVEKKQISMQAEHNAQEYARKREAEYPSIAELTVALYDEDDKAAIETKRAAVKKKWPKDNSGPVE